MLKLLSSKVYSYYSIFSSRLVLGQLGIYQKVLNHTSTTNITMDVDEHQAKDRLLWIDMEMTGLDVLTCHILEVACLITDAQLNVLAQGPDLIINQPDHILDNMNTWCVEHHGQSGLSDACRKSKISLQDAEHSLMAFIKTYIPKGKCCIAGNSVYMDRLFLQRYMPLVDSHLHYRIVDVSTIKELCRRWNPQIYNQAPKKVLNHRALDDIKESLEELRYYRSAIFIQPDNEPLRSSIVDH